MTSALYNIKTNRQKTKKLFYSASFKHFYSSIIINIHRKLLGKYFNETRDVKVAAAKAFPPEVLAGAVAADEIFFHVVP
jgi:deoxyribose-phosphate aldolase